MGLLASTIQGSSDTTFYVIALYYGSVGIIKNRYALPVGLFADFFGIIASFILVYLFFGM
jgi:spore maturation protein SpmB